MSHILSTKNGIYDIDTTQGAYEYLVNKISTGELSGTGIELVSFLYNKAIKIDKIKKEIELEIEFLKTKFTNDAITKLAVYEKILYLIKE